MQSEEYPELKFVQAASFKRGRAGYRVMFSVIHYTAGSERATSAEDGAAYDARRTDRTSCHQFHDRDSTVACVDTTDTAHAARHHGNLLGVQHELCGTAQTRAQWLDPASYGTLLQAAQWVAADCRKYGLEPRRLSVSETRRAWTEYPNGPRGIVGHVDCTQAFPEDNGDHTDPGEGFPWDVFLDMVRAELAPREWDDMATEQQVEDAAYRAQLRILADGYAAAGGTPSADPVVAKRQRNIRDYLRGIVGGPTEDDVAAAKTAILAAVAAMPDVTLTNEQAATVAQAAADAVRPAVAGIDSLRAHLGDTDTAQV